jgi:hypothetical protein
MPVIPLTPAPTPAPPGPPPPPTPSMMAITRAAADKLAFDHVINVLTDTLMINSKKANPYRLVCEHLPMTKTSHFDMLDEFVLDGEIPMLDPTDDSKHQYDSHGNILTFTLTKIEIKRLLALSMYWDNVIYLTPGGRPSVAEWHNLDEVSLGATLRNINASKIHLRLRKAPKRLNCPNVQNKDGSMTYGLHQFARSKNCPLSVMPTIATDAGAGNTDQQEEP